MGFIDTLPILVGQAAGIAPASQHYVGGMILSMGVLCTVGMAMAALFGRDKSDEKAGMVMISTTLFVTMGVLYVIDWLDIMFVIIGALIVGTMFAMTVKRMAD